jgi:hypothetical protein
MAFAPSSIRTQVSAVSEMLLARGYSLGEMRDYREPGAPYKGINSAFISPDGYLFELQFHTFESYFMNKKTHPAYERFRRVGTPPDERYRIEDRLAAQTEYLKWPIGSGDESAARPDANSGGPPRLQFFGSFLADPVLVRELFALVYVPWRQKPAFLLLDRISGRWYERADMLQEIFGVNREQCRRLAKSEAAQLAVAWRADLFTEADLPLLLPRTG